MKFPLPSSSFRNSIHYRVVDRPTRFRSLHLRPGIVLERSPSPSRHDTCVSRFSKPTCSSSRSGPSACSRCFVRVAAARRRRQSCDECSCRAHTECRTVYFPTVVAVALRIWTPGHHDLATLTLTSADSGYVSIRYRSRQLLSAAHVVVQGPRLPESYATTVGNRLSALGVDPTTTIRRTS